MTRFPADWATCTVIGLDLATTIREVLYVRYGPHIGYQSIRSDSRGQETNSEHTS